MFDQINAALVSIRAIFQNIETDSTDSKLLNGGVRGNNIHTYTIPDQLNISDCQNISAIKIIN